jgi:hypothetical protein
VLGRLVSWQISAPLHDETSAERETIWNINIGGLEPAVSGLAIRGMVRRSDGSVDIEFARSVGTEEDVDESPLTMGGLSDTANATASFPEFLGGQTDIIDDEKDK